MLCMHSCHIRIQSLKFICVCADLSYADNYVRLSSTIHPIAWVIIQVGCFKLKFTFAARQNRDQLRLCCLCSAEWQGRRHSDHAYSPTHQQCFVCQHVQGIGPDLPAPLVRCTYQLNWFYPHRFILILPVNFSNVSSTFNQLQAELP